MKVSAEVQKAYEKTLESYKNSYSPYSKFKVASTVKIKNQDRYFGGCNIENASYGATMCAERVAIFSSIGELGVQEFDFIVILANTDPAVTPCALCLQVMAEFCPPEFPIYLANLDGIKEKRKLEDFLPRAFNQIPKQL